MSPQHAEPAQPITPSDDPAPRTTRTRWRWLRIGVTLALLALVLSSLDLRDLGATLAAARPDALVALIGLLLLQRFLAALRWWLLARCNNPGLGLWSVIRVTFGSDFAGQFLPGAVGVELLRICGIARLTGNNASALSSVVADRLFSIAGLAVLVLLALAAAPRTFAVDPSIAWSGWITLAIVVVAAAAAMSPRVRRTAERLVPAPVAARLESKLHKLYASLDQYRARPGLIIAAVALAIIFQFLRVLTYYVGALALGIEAPFIAFAVFIPVIIFLTLLPISLGGYGVREAAFMYLFATVGVSAESAVALSLFVQVVHILCTLPGAWFCAVAPAPANPRPARHEPPLPVQPLVRPGAPCEGH